MIFRLSQKLAKKLKTGATHTLPLDDNPYADWSCHLFTSGRTQYIMVSNTKSLYSAVMYGKGITDDDLFFERAMSTIRDFMEDDGQAFVYRRFIAPASHSAQFGKALNRSVTGSMNELINSAKSMLSEDDISPHDVGFRLNNLLLSSIASSNEGYSKPNKAFKLLADSCSASDSGELG